jgi:hypothetical protein
VLPPDDETETGSQVVALPGASPDELRHARLEDEVRDLKQANRILLRLLEYLTDTRPGPRH